MRNLGLSCAPVLLLVACGDDSVFLDVPLDANSAVGVLVWKNEPGGIEALVFDSSQSIGPVLLSATDQELIDVRLLYYSKSQLGAELPIGPLRVSEGNNGRFLPPDALERRLIWQDGFEPSWSIAVSVTRPVPEAMFELVALEVRLPMTFSYFEDGQPIVDMRICTDGVEICATTDDTGSAIATSTSTEMLIRGGVPGSYPHLWPYTKPAQPGSALAIGARRTTIDLFANDIGHPFNEATGTIGYQAIDEDTRPVSGVSATIQPASGIQYFVNTNATASAELSATTSVGSGAFAQVAPGTVTLSFDHPTLSCAPIVLGWPGSAPGTVRAFVRAGHVTVLPYIKCR